MDETGQKSESVGDVERGVDDRKEKNLRERTGTARQHGSDDVGAGVGCGDAEEAETRPRRERSREHTHDEKRRKDGRDELPRPHLAQVFLQDANLPKPVLKVLPKKRPKRAAAVIAGADVGGEEDPRAARSEPVVVFVVLIADEFLVERARENKRLACIGGEGDGIDEAGPFLPCPERRAAYAKA
ncbi:MAG TPA: hypothetical protein VII77_04735, partial [Candidatus Deferrimicrobium sp.]